MKDLEITKERWWNQSLKFDMDKFIFDNWDFSF